MPPMPTLDVHEISRLFHPIAYAMAVLFDAFHSPRTRAEDEIDLEIDQFLKRELPLVRDLPVLSEHAYPDFAERSNINDYWLVDPLDGTKEFIRGEPDFCVSVALLRERQPRFALLAVPSTGEVYWAQAR